MCYCLFCVAARCNVLFVCCKALIFAVGCWRCCMLFDVRCHLLLASVVCRLLLVVLRLVVAVVCCGLLLLSQSVSYGCVVVVRCCFSA